MSSTINPFTVIDFADNAYASLVLLLTLLYLIIQKEWVNTSQVPWAEKLYALLNAAISPLGIVFLTLMFRRLYLLLTS